MIPDKFTHLHLHTTYSVLDAVSHIEDLVERAAEDGQKALAITDHGTLSGAIEFYKACRKADIRPIIGMEVYCARMSAGEPKSKINPTDHLVLLARNESGLRNLIWLATEGATEGFHYVPRIDRDMLSFHKEGLIGTSACLSGAISRIGRGERYYNRSTKEYEYTEGSIERAIKYAGELKDCFEKDSFFLEIQDHSTANPAGLGLTECHLNNYKEMVASQSQTMSIVYEIARKIGAPMVATNDVHMVNRDHYVAKDTIFAIRTNQHKNDQTRTLVSSSDAWYLKPQDLMCALFKDHKHAVQNTAWIAEQCDVNIKLGESHIPVFDTGGEELVKFWRRQVRDGLRRRYPESSATRKRALERAEHEIHVIEKMGFVSYFLMVADFTSYARSRGIPVGPGRGSVAGSIVAYSLGITELCPLGHGLLFERFLNSERVSLPDIDLDFCKERIGEVYTYAREKYGTKNVARIATFTSMWARSLIRELGKAHGIAQDEIDIVASSIADGGGEFRARIKSEIEDNATVKAYYESYPTWKAALDEAVVLEGSKRAIGKHAAGIVIGDTNLRELIPLMRPIKRKAGKKSRSEEDSNASIDEAEDMLFTQYPMNDLEDLGLIKMDFLALETLTIINRCQHLVTSAEFPSSSSYFTLDDAATYELLASGNALGVFQCESTGLRQLLMRIRPSQFSDIVAAIALYRPGPIDAIDEGTGMTMLETYVQNRNRRKSNENFKWRSYHEKVDPVLAETYGVIIFQEQVMQICRELCGYSMNDADRVRKIMGKKKPELMAKEKPIFTKAALEHSGVSEGTAKELFDVIAASARYSFNKSHSAAYSVLTYRTAWLKAHCPTQFMTALLTSAGQKSSFDDQRKYIEDCMCNGIRVLAPDINRSHVDFIADGDSLIAGLSMIKGISKVADKILQAREGGKFTSFDNAVKRLVAAKCNKGALESLIHAGAMDALGSRVDMLATLEKSLPAIRKYDKRREQFASIIGDEEESEARMEAGTPESQDALDKITTDYLGVYAIEEKQGGLRCQVLKS